MGVIHLGLTDSSLDRVNSNTGSMLCLLNALSFPYRCRALRLSPILILTAQDES